MDMPPRIAVVEDDPELGPLICDLLKREGFQADLAISGVALDDMLRTTAVDLIVLDLMLPGEDGISICRRLRGAGERQIPILMLTAKADDIDKIIGLEIGADDYLGKPFNPRELVARIRAVLRRTGPDVQRDTARLCFAGFVADLASFEVMQGDASVTLTSGEFSLLAVFLRHPGRVLSRDYLMEHSQSRSTDSFDRTVDVQISRLRAKLGDDPRQPALIKTVRNAGYIFTATVRSQ